MTTYKALQLQRINWGRLTQEAVLQPRHTLRIPHIVGRARVLSRVNSEEEDAVSGRTKECPAAVQR